MSPSASQRPRDLALLTALLAESTVSRLRDGEPEAFESMLNDLEAWGISRRGRKELTEGQRQWVEDATNRLELDDPNDNPAERNKNVPRGKEVAPAAVLLKLPLAPPGRRPAPR